MKLIDTILIAIAIAFLYIGVHQTLTIGFAESYWIFMFAISCLILYYYRKRKQQHNKTPDKPDVYKKPSGKLGKK